MTTILYPYTSTCYRNHGIPKESRKNAKYQVPRVENLSRGVGAVVVPDLVAEADGERGVAVVEADGGALVKGTESGAHPMLVNV